MGSHEGHRERLREAFLNNGLSSFNDINALELLLFYAIPRRDTNELAHALLNKFGSIDRVFSASLEELTEVSGIGTNAAVLLRLVPELMKKSAIAAADNIVSFRTRDDFGRFLVPRFLNECEEVFLMLCLNNSARLISCLEIGRGDINSVFTSPRKVAERALRQNAAAVVLAHNHPQGLPIASAEDILCTRKIKQALELLDIKLLDHLIVAGEEYASISAQLVDAAQGQI